MKYKAIITDLDGTAVDSPVKKVVSDRLTLAIEKLDSLGIKVCAATGRAPTYAKIVLESMGLTDPCIVAGGTKIINPTSEDELWSCGLSSEQMHKIVDALKTTPYKFTWNDSTEADYLNGGWSISEFNEFDSSYFFEVCFVPHNEVSAVVELLKDIPDIAVTIVVAQQPGMNDIHITHKAATKEHAIYELEKIIGVPKDKMIGIGDGNNDIHLFNAVGLKVAMGNAVPELKDVADIIIGSITDDGLAEYFEKLIEEIIKS